MDNDGSIWQASIFHLINFDGFIWKTFEINNSPLTSVNVNSLSIDENGNKWIGTQNGILIYNDGGIIISNPVINLKNDETIVYPNPFNNSFEIKLEEILVEANLVVFDLLGNIIFSSISRNVNLVRFERNNLANGIYIYLLKSKDKIISSGKVIAE